MPQYRVKHGTVRAGGKLYHGDKHKPGKGDTLELDAKDAAIHVLSGVLEPVTHVQVKAEDDKPKGKFGGGR